MGSRTSNPSLTTRATLSPEDDDASAEEETDTCTISVHDGRLPDCTR